MTTQINTSTPQDAKSTSAPKPFGLDTAELAKSSKFVVKPIVQEDRAKIIEAINAPVKDITDIRRTHYVSELNKIHKSVCFSTKKPDIAMSNVLIDILRRQQDSDKPQLDLSDDQSNIQSNLQQTYYSILQNVKGFMDQYDNIVTKYGKDDAKIRPGRSLEKLSSTSVRPENAADDLTRKEYLVKIFEAISTPQDKDSVESFLTGNNMSKLSDQEAKTKALMNSLSKCTSSISGKSMSENTKRSFVSALHKLGLTSLIPGVSKTEEYNSFPNNKTLEFIHGSMKLCDSIDRDISAFLAKHMYVEEYSRKGYIYFTVDGKLYDPTNICQNILTRLSAVYSHMLEMMVDEAINHSGSEAYKASLRETCKKQLFNLDSYGISAKTHKKVSLDPVLGNLSSIKPTADLSNITPKPLVDPNSSAASTSSEAAVKSSSTGTLIWILMFFLVSLAGYISYSMIYKQKPSDKKSEEKERKEAKKE